MKRLIVPVAFVGGLFGLNAIATCGMKPQEVACILESQPVEDIRDNLATMLARNDGCGDIVARLEGLRAQTMAVANLNSDCAEKITTEVVDPMCAKVRAKCGDQISVECEK